MGSSPSSPPIDGDELSRLLEAYRRYPIPEEFWPLARLLLASGRFEDAIPILRQGIIFDPRHPEARAGLARALLALGKNEEAVRQLRALLGDDPAHVDAAIMLGETLLFLGDTPGAEGPLARARSLVPEDPFVAELLEQAPADRGSGRKLGKLALKRGLLVEERSRPRKPARTRTAAQPASGDVSVDGSAELSGPPLESSRSAPNRMSGSLARAIQAARASGVTPRPTAPRGGARTLEGRRSPWRSVLIGLVGASALAGALALALRQQAAPPEPPRWDMPPEVPGRLALGRPVDLRWAERQLAPASGPGGSAGHGAAAALAALAEQKALALVEYGEGSLARARTVLAAAEDADRQGAHAGTRAVVRAALALAEIGGAPSTEALSAARVEVDRALVLTRGDARAGWLDGTLRALAGDREGARGAFMEAAAVAGGPVAAEIALGDLFLDGGQLDDAATSYERGLARAPGHPRALLGRALLHAARGALSPAARAAALADVDVALREAPGLAPWAALARGALLASVDADAADRALDTVPSSAGHRALLWLALLRIDRGEIVEAGRLGALVAEAGDPSLRGMLDAELSLARGLPEAALAAAGVREDARARIVRGRALLDLGRAEDAEAELRRARVLLPGDPAVVSLHLLARALAGEDRDGALRELQQLASAGEGMGLARLHLGEARLALGHEGVARAELERARDGNPQAYRAHLRLAELTLTRFQRDRKVRGDARHAARALGGVEATLRAALAQSPELSPARALLGRYLVATGSTDAAVAALAPVSAAGRTSAADELALAEALLHGGDRERAREAVRRAAARGATPEELRPLALRVDRRLVDELGL